MPLQRLPSGEGKEELVIPDPKEYPRCSVCVWCWEAPDCPIYCRLGIDPDQCSGPQEDGE